MVLELHVWGPAFGLPSIDPECNAAIAYCAFVLPHDDWVLIASNDPSVSPDNILPALHDGRGTWKSGYSAIVCHIAEHRGTEADSSSSSSSSSESTSMTDGDIDRDLTPMQRADVLACASYLATRGSALLAMSLYVSPTAWAQLTRPAYSALLPFPLTWTVPPALRHAAIERVEHLGLGHLAAGVDGADPSTSASADSGATTTSTGFLRLPARLGPGTALGPEQASAIRLQSLAEDFFAVLDGLRGRFLLRDDGRPCSLDFLVHGYLKLMQVQTPHPFLDTVLKRSYPELVRFVQEMDTVVPLSGSGVDYLPWSTPAPTSTAGILSRFADGIVENVPGVGEGWKRWRRRGISEEDAGDPAQVVLAVGGALAGVAALGGGLLFRSLSPFGAGVHRFELEKEDKGGLYRFGEVGAMLQGLPAFVPPKSVDVEPGPAS